MKKPIKRYFKAFTPSSVNEDEHTVRVRMTTEDVDRHGESVSFDGWDFKDFLDNPVVLVNHNDYELPIGSVIEIIPVPEDRAYDAVVKFDVDDEEGARVWGKVSRGFLKTVSVGFINLVQDGMNLLENSLLELSFVTIPANPQATVRSLKDGGLTVEDAQWLKDKAENELRHLTKFLASHKVKDNSKEATMTKEELDAALEEKLKPITDALATVTTALEAAATKDAVTELAEKVETLNTTVTDTNAAHDDAGHKDDDELSDEEAQKILDEFEADLAKEFPEDNTDGDDE